MDYIADFTGVSESKLKEIDAFNAGMTNKLDRNQEVIIALNDVISKLRQELVPKLEEAKSLKATIAKQQADQAFMINELKSVNSALENSKMATQELKKEFSIREAAWNKERQQLNALLEAQKKESLLLTNRLGALTSRLSQSEEVNRQVLLKSLEASKRYEELSAKLSVTQKSLDDKNSLYVSSIETLKKDHSDKARQMITDNTKRIVALMAQVEYLRKDLKQKELLLNEKQVKEQALVNDFVSKFKTITGDSIMPPSAAQQPSSLSYPKPGAFRTETVESVPEPFIDIFKGITAEMEEEEIEDELPYEPDTSLLKPMIERALENGDTDKAVVDSLVSSGYQRQDVVGALRRVKLENNELN